MPGGADYGALLDALRGVRWPARRRVGASIAGAHRSKLRGAAPEFSEYRPYRQGDDSRRIDWKLLARTDRAAIRLADDHAVLATGIVLDASPSMAFPAQDLGKWRLACRIALGLAAVARTAGDPVALALRDGNAIRVLPPRTRRTVLSEIAQTMDATRPVAVGPLVPLLASLRACPRVVVLSDFLAEEDELLRAGREHVAAGGEVHAVHIVAREELEPSARAIMATDPEDPQVQRPLVEETRESYRAAFASWRAALAGRWRAAGASHTVVITDEVAEHAVRRVAGAAPGTGGA